MTDFYDTYNSIHHHGDAGKSRGAAVQYALGTVITGIAGDFPTRFGDNVAIGIMEGLQFIAGTAELAPLKACAPNAKHELFGLNSYYGPRTASQFPRVIEELRRYRDSRRAVLMVAHPGDSPDTIPCTTSIQFLRSQPNFDVLHTSVNMRSSDLVYGMPYDIIQFSMVAYAVASCLGIAAGGYQVYSANAHIYDTTAVPYDVWDQGEFAIPASFREWEDWVTWARGYIYRDTLLTRKELLSIFQVRPSTR